MTAPKGASRIIFVPFVGAVGGVERLVLSLSRYLHDRGLAHLVLTFRDDVNFASYADWPLAVHELRPMRNVAHEVLALRAYLHGQDSRVTMLAMDLKGAFYASAVAVPYVVHLTDPPSLLHSDVSKFARASAGIAKDARATARPLLRALRGEIAHAMNSRGVRRARAVVVMTRRIADEVKHLYRVQALIIRPGVGIPVRGNTRRDGKPQEMRFLSVSRLEASKRISWIIKTLRYLEEGNELPEFWRLDIVGGGSQEQEIREQVRDAGIQERVIFHGRVDDSRLASLYDAATVFLMPAVQGWGLPALEALCRGVPVVIHGDSGVKEILAGNPWVESAEGAEVGGFIDATRRMINRIREGALLVTEPPYIPTETEWAAQICGACHWDVEDRIP